MKTNSLFWHAFLWIVSVIPLSSAVASGLSFNDDFEGDGKTNTVISTVDQAGLRMEYRDSNGQAYTYHIDKYDECSLMGMYELKSTRQIAIDGSCPSQGGQIYIHVYQWDKAFKSWCLRREITGEKANPVSGDFVPRAEVARVSGCSKPGARGPYDYEINASVRQSVLNELRDFRKTASSAVTAKKYVEGMTFFQIYELSSYIDANTVNDINDIAFFLAETGRSYDAISLLQKIADDFPQRVVTKLNLADAYWENGLNDMAIGQYKSYRDEMASKGVLRAVPPRVFARIRNKSS